MSHSCIDLVNTYLKSSALEFINNKIQKINNSHSNHILNHLNNTVYKYHILLYMTADKNRLIIQINEI